MKALLSVTLLLALMVSACGRDNGNNDPNQTAATPTNGCGSGVPSQYCQQYGWQGNAGTSGYAPVYWNNGWGTSYVPVSQLPNCHRYSFHGGGGYQGCYIGTYCADGSVCHRSRYQGGWNYGGYQLGICGWGW